MRGVAQRARRRPQRAPNLCTGKAAPGICKGKAADGAAHRSECKVGKGPRALQESSLVARASVATTRLASHNLHGRPDCGGRVDGHGCSVGRSVASGCMAYFLLCISSTDVDTACGM